MRFCYHLSSKILLAMTIVFSPLAAQEDEDMGATPAEEMPPASPSYESSDSELQNWIFAIGAAVAAAIGISIVSIHNGHSPPHH